jgi:hypothetical protein
MALTWMVGGGMAACLFLTTLALCAAAGRADAAAREQAGGVVERPLRHDALPAGPDDLTARQIRTTLRGRSAWVFSSPAAHARLGLTGRAGVAVPPAGEALALRVAGLAINGEVPVIVPAAASGPLGDTVLIGVAVPFADGRAGALVVAGGSGMAARPWIAHVLQELAIERAELGVPVRCDARAERFTVARERHAFRH